MILPLAAQQAAEETLGPALRQSWSLVDLPPAWVIVLLVLPTVVLLSWLGYRHQGISPRWRLVLGSLRAAAVLLLLTVLARPVLVEHREEVEAPQVLLALDNSASMGRRDTYPRAVQADLERLLGRPADQLTRAELAQAALTQALLPILAERGYSHGAFAFSNGLTPIANFAPLSDSPSADSEQGAAAGQPPPAAARPPALGNATHIGDALTRLAQVRRGQHVTDVVLVSDGRNTGGRDVLRAARALGSAGITLSTVLVGDLRRERNTSIELIEAPPQILEGDEIAVTLRVRGTGFDGAATNGGGRGRVILEELSTTAAQDEALPLSEASVALTEAGERLLLVAPPALSGGGALAESKSSLRRFRARLLPAPGESLLDDNSVEFAVRITREQVRVLYVDGYPRWEYRYLKNLLLRSDARLASQCYLLSATVDFIQESSDGLPPLTRVPTERRELLDSYDVIILGDVNPYAISPDPARGEAFVASLVEFVEGGGGLLTIAGEYDMPRAVTGSIFASLLPVDLDSSGALAFEGDTTTEFRPLLENPAAPHSIVRLHQDAATNQRLWESEGGLRGFYWYAPVVRARPGAEVLLRHPNHTGNYGRRPLLVTGYHPAGRTLFLAVDSTWRWRYRFNDRYHDRFWRNAIRWLALGRLRGGDRRYQLESLRSTWELGGRMTLEARVLDEDYRPSTRQAIGLRVSAPDGTTHQESLELQANRAGLYRLSLAADRPGLWSASIEEGGQSRVRTEFTVELPSRETADPTPDPELMAAAAALTGGVSLALPDLAGLMAQFPGDEELRKPISSRVHDAWDRWATLLLCIVLLAAEWILRKRLELV